MKLLHKKNAAEAAQWTSPFWLMKRCIVPSLTLTVLLLACICIPGWAEAPQKRIAFVADKPQPVVIRAVQREPTQRVDLVSLGTFKLTYYCACSRCCGQWADGITATGTEAMEGRTVAVDPSVIPLGSTVVIGGHEYIAEDTGARGKHIDIYMESHQACLQAGVGHEEVFIYGK